GTIPLPVLPARSDAATAAGSSSSGDKVHISVETVSGADDTALGAIGSVGINSDSPTTQAAGPSTSHRISWPVAAFSIVWFAGIVGNVARLIHDGGRAARQLRASNRLVDANMMPVLRAVAQRLGLKKVPEVRLVLANGGPFVIGGWKPTICLPWNWFDRCHAEPLRMAVAHEMAHIARRDLLWNRMVVGVRIVLFFHPLIWLASRRYQAAQELACDELALRRTGGSPVMFARMLLQLAEQSAVPNWAGAAAMMGAKSTLRERIEAMNRNLQVTSPVATAIVLGVFGLALFVTPFSLAEQPKDSRPSGSGRTLRTESKEQESSKSKKSISASASASANASASGQAFGFGAGQGNGQGIGIGAGNGQGRGVRGAGQGFGQGLGQGRGVAGAGAGATTRSSTSTRSSVSLSSDDDSDDSADSESDSPRYEDRDGKRSSTRSSSIKQSMTSRNDGDGEKWVRKTEVNENGRRVVIEEEADEIRVTIRNADSAREIAASDAKELRQDDPEAYRLYQKYVSNRKKSATSATFDLDSATPPDARNLLRDQLRELREQQDIQGGPLDDLLRDLEEQIADE
ncbi:MAG: hypothetical protein KDA71_08075, partial [Planctomycetales bacterium]|nr:hypothetical protein [Planctomycetales bacterium]